MVTVGNPGNAADTRYDATGFGSVGYVYQIGKYEVTAGQYTEFLNAVAKADPNGLYNTAMGDHGLLPWSWCKHPANRFFPQLQLQRGRRLGQPAGELRELLGRGPVCQLAPQRPADGAAGSGNHRGRRVHQHRQSSHRLRATPARDSSSPPRTSGTRRPITIRTPAWPPVTSTIRRGRTRCRETISPKHQPGQQRELRHQRDQLCDWQPVLSHGCRRIRVVRQPLRHVRPRRQRVGVERNGCDQFVAWSAWRVVRHQLDRPACVLPLATAIPRARTTLWGSAWQVFLSQVRCC